MLKFDDIKIDKDYPGYGVGAKPGFTCSVTLQHGKRVSPTLTIELTPEEVREVIAFAVSKAVSHLTFDAGSIDVDGHPGERKTPEPAPMPADALLQEA